MPRYRITTATYVKGVYYEATAAQPAVVDVPDDVEPSRRWEPLDDAARAALSRLGVAKAVVPTPSPMAPAPQPVRPITAPEAPRPSTPQPSPKPQEAPKPAAKRPSDKDTL